MDNRSISGATVLSSRIPPNGPQGQPALSSPFPTADKCIAAGAMGPQIQGMPQIVPVSHAPPGYGPPSHGHYPSGLPTQLYMPQYSQYPYPPYSPHMGAPIALDRLPQIAVHPASNLPTDTYPYGPMQGLPPTPSLSPAVPHMVNPQGQNVQNGGTGQQLGVNDASIPEAPIWCFQCQQWHPSKQAQEQIHTTIQAQSGYNPGIIQSQYPGSAPPDDFFNTRMNQAIRDAVAAQLASRDGPLRQEYYNRGLEGRKQPRQGYTRRKSGRISDSARHDDRYRAISPGLGRDYEETRTATPSDARAWHDEYTDDDPDDIRAESVTNVSAAFSDMMSEDHRRPFPKRQHRQKTSEGESSEEDTGLPLKYFPSKHPAQYSTQHPTHHPSRPRQYDTKKKTRNMKQELSDSEVSYKPRRAREQERDLTQQTPDTNKISDHSHKSRKSDLRVEKPLRTFSGALSISSSNNGLPESPEIELYEAVISFAEWYAKNYGIDQRYITKLQATLDRNLQTLHFSGHRNDKNTSKQAVSPESPKTPMENTEDCETSTEISIANYVKEKTVSAQNGKSYRTKETVTGDSKKGGSNNVKSEAKVSVGKGQSQEKESLEAKMVTQKTPLGKRARSTQPGSPVKSLVPERTRRQYSLVLDEYSRSLTTAAPDTLTESKKATAQIPVALGVEESTMGSLGLDYLMTKHTVDGVEERQRRAKNSKPRVPNASQRPPHKATVETVIDDYDNADRLRKALETRDGQRYTNISPVKEPKYTDTLGVIKEEQKNRERNITQRELRNSPVELQPEYTNSEIRAADQAGSSDASAGEYASAVDEQEWEDEEEEAEELIDEEDDQDQDCASEEEEASDTDEILLELLSDGRYSDVISGMFSDADTEAMPGVIGAYGGDRYKQDGNMAARLRSRLNEFGRGGM